MKHLLKAISLSFLLIISTQANATFISGEYSFVGLGSFETTFSGDDLTEISFGPGLFGPTGPNIGVTGTYGDYNAFSFPSAGYIYDIDVAGQTGFIELENFNTGAYGEFEITNVSADLSDWSINDSLPTGGSGTITLKGSLLAYLDDPDALAPYEDTITEWVMTLNSGGQTGSYSGTVPEPATLALFGMGLLGLSFARRKRKA